MRRLVLIVRLLATVGVGVLLFGSSTASARGAAFEGTITPGCVVPGQSLTIALHGTGADDLVYAQITYEDNAPGGGKQTIFARADSQGTFTTRFTIPATAMVGAGSVLVMAFDPAEMTVSYPADFTIGTAAGCSTPGVNEIIGSQASPFANFQVKKTCDPGVSGNAVFSLSVAVLRVTLEFPPLTLSCNGAEKDLPVLPLGSTVTLHESVLPTGAAAAADTKVMYPPLQVERPITIHNARAAAVVSPTPRPTSVVRLPPTGGGTPPNPTPWWLSLALVAVAVSTAGWIVARGRES